MKRIIYLIFAAFVTCCFGASAVVQKRTGNVVVFYLDSHQWNNPGELDTNVFYIVELVLPDSLITIGGKQVNLNRALAANPDGRLIYPFMERRVINPGDPEEDHRFSLHERFKFNPEIARTINETRKVTFADAGALFRTDDEH